LRSRSPPYVAHCGDPIGHKEQQLILFLDVHVHVGKPRHEILALSLDDQCTPWCVHLPTIPDSFHDAIADDDDLVFQDVFTIHRDAIYVHKGHLGVLRS
jgi:hypothetical protein